MHALRSGERSTYGLVCKERTDGVESAHALTNKPTDRPTDRGIRLFILKSTAGWRMLLRVKFKCKGAALWYCVAAHKDRRRRRRLHDKRDCRVLSIESICSYSAIE